MLQIYKNWTYRTGQITLKCYLGLIFYHEYTFHIPFSRPIGSRVRTHSASLVSPISLLPSTLFSHCTRETPLRRTVRRIPARYLACRRADLANVMGVEGAIKKGPLVWENPSRAVGCRQTLNCKLPMTAAAARSGASRTRKYAHSRIYSRIIRASRGTRARIFNVVVSQQPRDKSLRRETRRQHFSVR